MDTSPRGLGRKQPEVLTPRNLKMKMSLDELPDVSPRGVGLSRVGGFCDKINEELPSRRPRGILKQRRRESEFIRMKDVILEIKDKK
mmetsp:Transcript_39568/g.60466  ORF Transcript_39568/g.60466 Transcript_39568/m.60466 type:complete len:87 (+) Transcript_39568:299-559(+)